MTAQELEILISQTLEEMYHKAYDNNLTDAEYDYFIHSILYNISLGLSKSAYKAMKNENSTEGKCVSTRPQGEWIFRQGVTCGGYYKCNRCGEVERAEKNYCSNCGAEMGGKAE